MQRIRRVQSDRLLRERRCTVVLESDSPRLIPPKVDCFCFTSASGTFATCQPLVAGVPASRYDGTIEVNPKGGGCVVVWRVQFLANNQPDIVVRTMVSTLVKTGLGSLKSRFAAAA